MAKQHILCLHSFWRTASTYFWEKLRSAPDCVAFYEPFHECLNQAAVHLPDPRGSQEWNSGHPLVADYWEEYRQCRVDLADIGQKYPGQFNKQDYFKFTTSKKEQIDYLLNAAFGSGSTMACLCFTRSLGSSLALRHHLQDDYPDANQIHVLLKRDPWNQFSSYMRFFLRGQYAFIWYFLIPLSSTNISLDELIGCDISSHRELSFFDSLKRLNATAQHAFSNGREAQLIMLCAKAFIATSMLQLGAELAHWDHIIDTSQPSAAQLFSEYLQTHTMIDFETHDYKPFSQKVLDIALSKAKFANLVNLIFRRLDDAGLITHKTTVQHYYAGYLA
jgi:hypothetical protein